MLLFCFIAESVTVRLVNSEFNEEFHPAKSGYLSHAHIITVICTWSYVSEINF